MKNKENIYIVILALFIALGFIAFSLFQTLKGQLNLNEALTDTLEVWMDKDGVNHAKIQVLETQKTKTFLTLETNDETIKELQKVVKNFKKVLKKKGSATVITTSTDINTTSQTKVVFEKPEDSINTKIFPIYKSNFNLQGWVIGKATASKDSTSLSLSIKNEYAVVIGRESQGLFKPSKPFVEVINKNPFTQVKSLRTYEVSTPSSKKFSIGPILGIGFNGKPIGGIGVSYGIIKF